MLVFLKMFNMIATNWTTANEQYTVNNYSITNKDLDILKFGFDQDVRVGWGCQKRNQWSIFLVLAANTVRIMDVLPAGAKVMSAMMYPFPNK